MKKNKYILLSICAVCAALLLAFFVNILFKIRTDSIFKAEWTAGDALNYVAAMTGAISTFVLSLIAYKQNEKLQQMEDNNYIAANSCMILINQVQVKPKANIPVNYELHTEQILQEKDNEDACPSGYSVEVRFKKISDSLQATPSMIYVSKCTLFVGSETRTLESDLWLENVREGYTRTAICESDIAFNCTLLVAKSKQEKFEEAIKTQNNKLTIEIEFNIVTDKYVMTKCKCRAYCEYQNSSGVIIWKSKEPMVFFYGHELMDRSQIKVLGEV